MGAFAGFEERDNRFESFIAERIKYRTLRAQFAITFAAGLGLALGAVGIYLQMYSTEAESIYGGMLFVLAFVYALLPIAFWFGVSVFTFLAARLLGARAEFGTIFRATGWGFLPLVGSTVVLGLGRYVALSNTYATVCDHPKIACAFIQEVSITEQVDHVFSLAGSIVYDPIFLGAFVLAAILYVLSWYLVAVAADEASTLTRAGGMVTTGIPMVAVGLGYVFNTFF